MLSNFIVNYQNSQRLKLGSKKLKTYINSGRGVNTKMDPISVIIHVLSRFHFSNYAVELVKGKGKGHPCTGTEALYRPYGP